MTADVFCQRKKTMKTHVTEVSMVAEESGVMVF